MRRALLLLLFATTAFAQDLRRSGFLGVRVEQAKPSGVEVKALVDGGSAKAAGIRIGDVITRINGHDVAGPDDFVQFAKSLHAGDVATLHLQRGDVKMDVKPRPFEQSPDANVFYRAAKSDDALRRVIVTAPKQPGRHPAILYIGGIGCFSQESLDLSTPESQLLYGLTRAGFVTMRVEKSGMGDSEGSPCSATDFNAEMHGYLAGLRALKTYDFVDPAKVFLVGLSIGGVEAPIVARQEPVHGLVVINTVSKPFLEYLLETRRRQGVLAKVAYDQLDRDMRLEESCNHRALIEKQPTEAQCAEHITYPAPLVYMQQWAAINPADSWKAIDVPVLVVYGTADIVATQADHPYLASMLNSFHPGSATLKSIDGMEHGLTTNGTLNPSVLPTIENWLADHS